MRKPLFKKRPVEELSDKRLVNVIKPKDKFGDWTVLHKGTKPDYLLCKCVCGVEREVHVYSLKSGKSKSCGCRRLNKETKNAGS